MATTAAQTMSGSDLADDLDHQRVRALQADAASPEILEARRQRTLRALADVDSGRWHDDEAVAQWVDRLGNSPPPPRL